MTRHVIWPQFLDGGHVIDAAWRAAKGGLVGTCPCGGYLRRGEPYPLGRTRTGYTATCSGCGHAHEAFGPSDVRHDLSTSAIHTGRGELSTGCP